MKKITTILLLVIANICNGQDSSKSTYLTYPALNFTPARTAYTWELPHTKDFDTIPVILICIDTVEHASTTVGFIDPYAQAAQEGRIPFWVKAIKINRYVFGGWKTGDYYSPAHWEHYTYLKRDMKPLNLVVVQQL